MSRGEPCFDSRDVILIIFLTDGKKGIRGEKILSISKINMKDAMGGNFSFKCLVIFYIFKELKIS